MSDAGTYTLVAENRNGKDKIDLDLIVLELMHDPECDMFKTANLQCSCSSGFRYVYKKFRCYAINVKNRNFL